MTNPLSATLAAFGQRLSSAGAPLALAEEQRLDGRTCLVTGASSGLGKALAIALAGRGARVLLACRRTDPAIAGEIARLAGDGGVEMRAVDLTDLEPVDRRCDGLRDSRERVVALVVL